MRALALAQVAWRQAAGSRSQGTAAALGLALGTTLLLVTLALGAGVRRWASVQLVQQLPGDMLLLVPQTLELGPLRLPQAGLLGGRPLDAQALDTLRQLPDVAAAYGTLDVPLPTGASGGAALFGRRLYTDLFLTALPEAAVRDAGCPQFVDPSPDGVQMPQGPIPLVVSPQLLALYNAAVAPALGAPQLSADALVGLQLELHVGRNGMLGRRGARAEGRVLARVVGTSPLAARLGATLPLGAARWLISTYGDASVDPQTLPYSGIFVRAHSPEQLAQLATQAQARGFTVDATAARINTWLTAGTSLLAGIGALVLLLAASQTAFALHVFVAQKRSAFAILQALGLQRRTLAALVQLQALGLGLVGGTAGIVAGSALCAGGNATAARLLPQAASLPQPLFVPSAALAGACLAAAVVAATLGAWGPARAACRRHPAGDLQG